MKRNQWAAALLALLLFGCGAAVGVLGDHFYASRSVSAHSSEDSRQHYLSDMESKLKLTTSQMNQLETILDDTKAKYKAVRDSYHPAMIKIKEEHVARVKSILTPEQVPAYERLLAEREKRARDQEERDRAQEQKRAEERVHRAAQ